jgi:N-acyl-D-amino-acid deacylase
MDDILIRGGNVIDGTGAVARRADVAIMGDRIRTIESACVTPAHRVIDARGLAVSPGFIDIKTHSDFALPLYPRAESRVHQGITTEIIGSCGFTAAPVPTGRVRAIAAYLAAMAPSFTFRETTFTGYLDSFPATSVNVAAQVGHTTVRVAVMGLERRAPTYDEQAAIERLLQEALDAGAIGVSSGPFTAPGAFAQPEELEAMARLASRRGAGYATHLRDEASQVFAAAREAIEVAERTGARTRIVHVKVSGADAWGMAKRLLQQLSAARERGVAIDCDHYPYTAALNPLRNLLPAWAQEGGSARLLERLKDPNARRDIASEIAAKGLNAFGRIPSWDAVRITMSPTTPEAAGLTIAQLAANRGCDGLDALCELLLRDGGATRCTVDAMHEDDVKAFLVCPWVFVGSDGRAFGPGGPLAHELPHPRVYGAFARVLGHYTRDLRLLSLEEAVNKMTGGPAAALGFVNRGVLKPGAAADVTVFDPSTISERGTYQSPRQYPAGIEYVIVNGVMVIDAGSHTGALPGRVLRRTASGVV